MARYFAAGLTLLILAGCSTDRQFTVTHERLVSAAIEAISEEAHVDASEITRTDKDKKDGPVTVLEAPYINYSRVEATIDSSGDNCNAPELGFKITTDEILWTRHKEWEWRLQELAHLKLVARHHGGESKPTALPAITPKIPPPASTPPVTKEEPPKN